MKCLTTGGVRLVCMSSNGALREERKLEHHMEGTALTELHGLIEDVVAVHGHRILERQHVNYLVSLVPNVEVMPKIDSTSFCNAGLDHCARFA